MVVLCIYITVISLFLSMLLFFTFSLQKGLTYLVKMVGNFSANQRSRFISGSALLPSFTSDAVIIRRCEKLSQEATLFGQLINFKLNYAARLTYLVIFGRSSLWVLSFATYTGILSS